MRSIVRLFLVVCCAIPAFIACPADAEKRVALVIGNTSYEHIAHLPNVPNDATAMAALFKAAKFDSVEIGHNLGVAGLRKALRDFAIRTADADVAVLFYAGHGIELGQVNYLIPVDARLVTDFDIEDETVPLDRFLLAMEPAKRLRLVLLDACRENPFLKSMKRTVAARSVGRGLGRIEPSAASTLIAFATKPNAIAEDGKGPNSPFTAALVKHLLTPGLDLRIALGNVRDEVMASTGKRQEPYVTSSLGGGTVSILAGSQAVAPPTVVPRPSEAADAWAAVKDTTSIAQLEVIAGRYKGTVYGDLAQARIAELRKQQAALPLTATTSPKTSSYEIATPDGKRYEVTAPDHIAMAEVGDWFTREVAGAPPKGAELVAVGTFKVRAVMPLAADEERVLRPKDSFKECAECPEMVVVPAGEFMMGLKDGDQLFFMELNHGNHVKPAHRVTLQHPFAAGKYEVTFAEWDACVAAGGCKHRPADEGWGRGRRPVINVSWHDAKEYVAWLAHKTGKSYRLLSEAEWEYAARAGSTTRYAFGDTISKTQAQFSADRTVDVGSFPANGFGLHDTHGNVWEWLEDCWNETYSGAPADGSAWVIGSCDRHVLRGGSWNSGPPVLHSADRFWDLSSSRYSYDGFRVARTL